MVDVIAVLEEWMREIGPNDKVAHLLVPKEFRRCVRAYVRDTVARDFERCPTIYHHWLAGMNSYWFITPRQHAIECISLCLVYLPVFVIALQVALNQPKWTSQLPIRKPTTVDLLCGIAAFGAVLATFYYKYISEGSWRVPFMLQPCHCMSFILGMVSFTSSKFSSFLFQVRARPTL